MLNIRILGLKKSQRYVVQRLITASVEALGKERPGLQTEITVVKDMYEMQHYTPVLVGPALMINEKMVCVGRIPWRTEVDGWLRAALEPNSALAPDGANEGCPP